ncbi:MAG: hypothetical protein U0703_11900 [Anaerolineae bacterium]
MANWRPTATSPRLNGGVFEFYHNTSLGNVRPSVLQNSGAALAEDTPVELRMDLGNSGNTRKRALVILFQYDWSDHHTRSARSGLRPTPGKGRM